MTPTLQMTVRLVNAAKRGPVQTLELVLLEGEKANRVVNMTRMRTPKLILVTRKLIRSTQRPGEKGSP